MTGKAEIRKNQGKKIISNNRTLTSGFNTSRKSLISSPSAPTTTSVWQQSAKTDLNMNTYDIYDVDRILFATTLGSGDELTSTDYGIEAISSSSSGVAFGMKFVIPASNTYQMFIGSTEMVNITTAAGFVLNGNITGGGHFQLSAMTAPSASSSTARKLYVDSADNHLKIRTNTSSIDLETAGGGGSWVSTATSSLNMSTYDINGIDRLIFSSATSSNDALLATDYGIEIDGGTTSIGLKYNVPSTKEHNFYVEDNLILDISSTGLNMYGKELDFNAGGRVDFADSVITIGANGAATALTANPVGYVKVKVGGTERQIPYYNT